MECTSLMRESMGLVCGSTTTQQRAETLLLCRTTRAFRWLEVLVFGFGCTQIQRATQVVMAFMLLLAMTLA